ncbi:Ig-like domain-containing protein [Anaerotignum sp.]|uniref:Ig-like domain-containing protein n=1 Tax=Anaerotignum sp. TaxID=2039241 RepID=UPI00289E1A11|nr:Ig-like domain-containing protein [Anaerotignum sp.]
MKRLLVLLMTLCMLTGLCSVNVYAEESLQGQDEGWQEEEPMPMDASNIRLVTVGDEIYYMDFETKGFKIYNVKTKVWKDSTRVPGSSLRGGWPVVVGKKIYIPLTQGSDPLIVIYIYDTETDMWSKAEQNRFFDTQYVSNVISVESKIYLLKAGKLWIFDTTASKWIEGKGRSALVSGDAAVVGKNIYFIGGNIGIDKSTPNGVSIYNIDTDTWSEGADMLTHRSFLTVSTVGSKIYALGGTIKSSTYTNSVEIYDTITNTWTTGQPNLFIRTGADSVVVNDKIYLMGGFAYKESELLRDRVETFQICNSSLDKRLFVLLNIGETVQLSITKNLSDNANFTWRSINQSIATVDAHGKVTAVAEGDTEIYAENADGTFKEYIPIKVVAGSADETRLATYLRQGEKIRLYLCDDPSTVTWRSMDESIATISETGQVAAIKNGLVIIQGELEGETYLFYVRVVSA